MSEIRLAYAAAASQDAPAYWIGLQRLEASGFAVETFAPVTDPAEVLAGARGVLQQAGVAGLVVNRQLADRYPLEDGILFDCLAVAVDPMGRGHDKPPLPIFSVHDALVGHPVLVQPFPERSHSGISVAEILKETQIIDGGTALHGYPGIKQHFSET